MDFSHLVHIEFARQHDHVGKLGIEAQSLYVADIKLGGEMDFLSDGIAVGHYRHIARNDRRDAGFVRRIHNFVHYGDVLAIDYGVYSEIGLYAVFVACGSDFSQVVNSECACRAGTHIQLSYAEIHGVGPSLNGSRQAFP